MPIVLGIMRSQQPKVSASPEPHRCGHLNMKGAGVRAGWVDVRPQKESLSQRARPLRGRPWAPVREDRERSACRSRPLLRARPQSTATAGTFYGLCDGANWLPHISEFVPMGCEQVVIMVSSSVMKQRGR